MAWNEILKAILGASVVFAQSTTSQSTDKVQVEELLAYECAKSISSLVDAGVNQPGPMFSAGSLVFTSLETSAHSVILLMNAGHGNYTVPLESLGVNRIRFTLPTAAKSAGKSYYLSYLHGGSMRSRYFEFGEDIPPLGHDELDYASVTPTHAGGLLPHFDYAIHSTAITILQNISDGLFDRKQLAIRKINNCEYINRQDPALARTLQRNIDQLDLIVMGPKRPVSESQAANVRGPASLEKSRPGKL